MSRLDPKPGRWILPLVVVGIVAFTWVFVNALPPAEDATGGGTLAATTTQPRSTTTTPSPVASSTTTSTTAVPAEIVQFVNAAETVAERADELLTVAQEMNDTWEEGRNFTLALNNFRDLADQTEAFSDGVDTTDVPDDFVADWDPVRTAADAMAVAADEMVRGLQAPDTGQIRKAALGDFAQAVADLTIAVDEAKDATGV